MSKRKKIIGRKTRSTGRSQRSAPVSLRRIGWPVGIGVLFCVIIIVLLVPIYLWQRNQQQQDGTLSSDSFEPYSKPFVSLTLSPEQEIVELKATQMKLARQVVGDFPNSGEAQKLMGDLHRRLGNSARAIEFWQKGLELSPKWADVYYDLGIVALEKGDYEQAISFWKKALEANPYMPGVHNSIARALMGLGRYDEAIKELEEDVRTSPKSSESLFLLGQAYLQQQEYVKARTYYERTIELEPENSGAYYGLSITYARLKKPDKAGEYRAIFKKLRSKFIEELKYGHSPLDDLSRIREGVAELSVQAARLYLAKGELGKAEGLLKQAIAVDPNKAKFHKRLAAFYRKTERIPAALAQCERVRQLEPNDPTCRLLIATLALQLKRVDRAETAFRQFIALCPNRSMGYRELAYLYIRANRKLSEAVKLTKKAVGLEPTAENYFILSLALRKTNDKQAALTAIGKAIELAPNNLEYRKMYDLIRYDR